MITAVGLTWFVRTKDMDFMPDTTVDAVEEEVVEEPFVLVGPPAPAKVDEEAFDAGFTLLGLDHFSNYLDNPQELLRTFKILKSKDNTELTYLAGERIMEHASISKEEKREQVPAMVEIGKSVEPYVIDINETRSLSIVLGGIPSGLRAPITAELRELIFMSSGGLVDLKILFEDGDPTLSVLFNGAQTHTPLSEHANVKDIISGLYILIATEMNSNGYQIPLWESASSEEFQIALTRLAWDELTVNLIAEPEKAEEE